LLNHKFGGEPDLIFLVHARSGSVDAPAATASGGALATRLATDARLSGVTSYWTSHAPSLRSKDRSDALILARVVGSDQQASTRSTAILADYKHASDAAVTVRIGGTLGTGVGSQVNKDLALAESIAVPITIVLLLLAFGSVVAALLPLSVGVLAIFATLAELNVLTHVTNVSVFAINLTTALGLGLGIDYALLMVSRFREELARGSEVGEAVARTTATAGRTIAFSALTVAAALSAMLVFPVYFLRSFAYAGVGVTAFAALSALLVLPALLSVLGQRVNAGRIRAIRVPGRMGRSVDPVAPFWGRLATAVMRRPVIAAIPVIAVLLLMATPLLHVSFSTPDDRVLPTSAASHQVGDALRTDFATQPDVIDVLVRPELRAPVLASYTSRLTALAGVQSASTTTAPGVQRISLSTGLNPSSGQRPAGSPGARRRCRRGAGRRQARDRLPVAARGSHHRDHDIRRALPVHRHHRPADPSIVRQRLDARRDTRRHGLDLPGRPPGLAAGIHPDTDQHVHAGLAVLHRVRVVHGLRGVSDEPHQRGA
jgi:RND superfamily putative drug exporter